MKDALVASHILTQLRRRTILAPVFLVVFELWQQAALGLQKPPVAPPPSSAAQLCLLAASFFLKDSISSLTF
jgi:hypothetical protein